MTVVVIGSSGNLGSIYTRELKKTTKEPVFGIDMIPISEFVGDSFFQCDVTDEEALTDIAYKILSSNDNPLSLINFAGVIGNQPVFTRNGSQSRVLKRDAWKTAFDQVFEPVLVPTLIFSALCAKRGVPLHVIQISSVSARGVAGQSAYASGKAAIEVLSVSLAKELGSLGVRLNSVRVGYTNSESLHANVSDTILSRYKQRIGLRKLLEPLELASFIERIRLAPYVNGAVISLDGAFD
jgi:3-oxoacyl-[acyl-carrier protein] reductase